MASSAILTSRPNVNGTEPKAKKMLAELRQMSLASIREEGLLNHAQAAVVLEVSTRRIGELVELGRLSRFNFLGRTYVSVREVIARRHSDVKAGRPTRTMGRKIRMAAKLLAHYDPVNATVDAFTPVPKKNKK